MPLSHYMRNHIVFHDFHVFMHLMISEAVRTVLSAIVMELKLHKSSNCLTFQDKENTGLCDCICTPDKTTASYTIDAEVKDIAPNATHVFVCTARSTP